MANITKSEENRNKKIIQKKNRSELVLQEGNQYWMAENRKILIYFIRIIFLIEISPFLSQPSIFFVRFSLFLFLFSLPPLSPLLSVSFVLFLFLSFSLSLSQTSVILFPNPLPFTTYFTFSKPHSLAFSAYYSHSMPHLR